MFKSKLKSLSTFALLFGVVLACKEGALRESTKTLKSPDGNFQMTVPDSWSLYDKPLKKDEIMQVARLRSPVLMVGVSFQDKARLADDMTLDQYTRTGISQMLAKGVGTEATTPEPLTVGGNQALQYVATLVVDNEKSREVCTVIETPDRFYSINAVVKLPGFDENKATLKQVSESFRPVAK